MSSGRSRRAISDPFSPSFELSGLKKYTEYTVQVLAYTVDYGVPSHEINMTTAQDGKRAVYRILRMRIWLEVTIKVRIRVRIRGLGYDLD